MPEPTAAPVPTRPAPTRTSPDPTPPVGGARRVTPPTGDEDGALITTPGPEEGAARPGDGTAAGPEAPLWERNAVPFEAPDDKPLLAVVIDNAAGGAIAPEALAALDLPVTLALVPDGSATVEALAGAAAAAGAETLVQIPMEPRGPADPGPDAIYVRMSDAEVQAATARLLDRLGGAVGALNRMGSRATEDRRVMDAVMAEIAARGLAFVDSRTSVASIADDAAAAADVPFLRNARFIPAGATQAQVADILERAARNAGTSGGGVVVIGPPTEAMLQGLMRWAVERNGEAARLAPVSAVLRRLAAPG